jgi:outer membrane receptor for ferrienterochelin and colicins
MRGDVLLRHRDTPQKATRTRFLLYLVALALLAAPRQIQAQTLEYGAAEKIFGEPVTISVTGSPQRASDAPADMDILTADDIRRSGATDIPGVLRHLVGIDVLQFTSNDSEIGIHGYDQPNSPRILVLIDGRQVYADYYGYTPWSTLPVELSAIRQIEVVKGPNSALFGFNAVGGVINIITYDPLNDDVNTASVTGGTQGLAQTSAVGTFKLGQDIAARVQIGGRRDDDFSTPVPALIFGTRGANSRASIDFTTAMRITDNLRLSFDASHTAVDQNDFPTGNNIVGVSYDVNSVLGRANLDSSLGLLQAQIYNNWLTYTFPTDLTNSIPGKLANQVTVARLEDIFKLGSDHTLRGTLEYRHNTVGTATVTGGHVFYDVVAVGAMWEWKITPRLTATNSLRIDHLSLGRDGAMITGSPFTNANWDRSVTPPSFNSSLVWRSDDLDTFRLNVSRGVLLPNLVNLGAFAELLAPANYTGVPTIDPTIVMNWQGGWTRKIPAMNANLKVTLYHQETSAVVSDVGQVFFTPSGIFVSPANIGDSRATGMDVEIDGKYRDDWRWSLGYSAEVITDRFINFQFAPIGVDFQHTTPVHKVNASLGWSHGNWEIDGFLRYESSFYGFTSRNFTGALARIDDFVTVDGRIGYTLSDGIRLSLSGQNLTQSSQRQTAGPNVERRIFGNLSVDF